MWNCHVLQVLSVYAEGEVGEEQTKRAEYIFDIFHAYYLLKFLTYFMCFLIVVF